MEKRGARGSILNFQIDSTRELRDVLDERASRVYLHKVLSSLSVGGSLETILAGLSALMTADGVLTWAEPEYIFYGILEAESESDLRDRLSRMLGGQRRLRIETYVVQSRTSAGPISENWLLVSAGLRP